MADAVSTGHVPWQLPCPCVPSGFQLQGPVAFSPGVFVWLLESWQSWKQPYTNGDMSWQVNVPAVALSLGYLGACAIPSPRVPPWKLEPQLSTEWFTLFPPFFLFTLLSSIFPSTSHFAIPPWRLPRSCPKCTTCKQLSV